MTRSGSAAVLAGYFGYGNAGDEMILRRLLEAAPQTDWVVLSGRPRWTEKLHGRPAAGRWNPARLARLFSRRRFLVLGGGELFQSRTSRASLLYYAALPLWARAWGCRVLAFGQGLDPRLSRWERRLSASALSLCDRIWVRDEGAAQALAAAGVSRPVAVMPDPVWAWPVEPAPRPSRLRRLLWILRFRADPAPELGRWIKTLNALSKNRPWEHGFLPFHPEHDLAPLEHLRRGLDFSSGLESWKELEDIFPIIKQYDAVVTMRFHGLAAALLAGRPAAAVADHAKVTQLARDLGAPCLSPEAIRPDSLAAAIEKAWDRPESEAAARVRGLRAGAAAALKDLAVLLKSQ